MKHVRNRLIGIIVVLLLVCLAGNMDRAEAASNDFEIEGTVLVKYNGYASDVTIPDGITEIGSYAFSDNRNIYSVKMPSSVRVIGERAFNSCHNLTSVTLSSGLKSIGDYAFCDTSITQMVIPEGTETVSYGAFLSCRKLKTISIPSTVSDIGKYVFEGCSSLEKITVSSGNSYYCSVNGVLYNKSKSKLIVLPGSCTQYSILSSVNTIGSGAVYGSITKLYLPVSVKKIEGYAINTSIDYVTSIIYGGTESDFNKIDVGEENTSLYEALVYYNGETPDIVSYAGNGGSIYFDKTKSALLYADKSIQSITIPSTIEGCKVTRICRAAFKDCNKLSEVSIPGTVKLICSSAFQNCSVLANVSFGYGIETIGEWAFYQCTALKKIDLPKSLKLIEDCAFQNCSGLVDVRIPDSVTEVGAQAFMECTSMKNVIIPKGLQGWMTKRVFSDCTSLETMYFPTPFRGAGCYNFMSNTNLRDVYFAGTKEQCSGYIEFTEEEDRKKWDSLTKHYNVSLAQYIATTGFVMESAEITTQPANKTVQVGNTATFTVSAIGKATLKYQWQCKAPGATTWTNSTQSGATTSKLSIVTNLNHEGYQYRCVVTNGNGKKTYSNSVTLHVSAKITTQPADKTAAVGTTATFTVAAIGNGTLTYQWQAKAKGASSWSNSTQSGAKTATLSVATTVNHNGYQYRCVVKDGNGNQCISNVATLTVTPKKRAVGLAVTGIKAPSTPSDAESSWTGSFIWYGKYEGKPVKYRVLTPTTTAYGGTTMLLDCNSILYIAPFDADGEANAGASKPNEWAYSDVKAGLNGSAFLTKANGFTSQERNAIANATNLSGEKIILLTPDEAGDSSYGFFVRKNDEPVCKSRVKKNADGNAGYWWLRETGYNLDGYAGAISSDGLGGFWYTMPVSTTEGVSPAFNINHSSVIFHTLITGTAGADNAEYKLTIADSAMKISVQSGKRLTVSGSKITIPYTITGNNAANATQVSVLILDKEYKAGNTNSAKIKNLIKLSSDGAFAKTGTGTFTLPSGLSIDNWGSGYYVYLIAEDVNGLFETDYASVPVKLSQPIDTNPPTITMQPDSTSVVVGNTATFTIEATSKAALTYQWQAMAPNASTWSNSQQSGAKTTTLSISTNVNHDGYRYRCVVTDVNGFQTISHVVSLTIKPKVETQPTSKSVTVGNTATFSVAAIGVGTLKYQWQAKAPDATTWSNSSQSGATTAKLSVATNVNHNGYQYRCVVTDGNGNKAYSSAATLTITPKITTQPAGKSVAVGDTAVFTVVATGKSTLTYQWQAKAPGATTWSNSSQSGATTAKLSVATNVNHNGYQYRCVVTDGNGKKSYSNAATLKVNPKITTQPANMNVKAGTTATFTVAVTGKTTLKYQWQAKAPGSTTWSKSSQSGATTSKLSVATTMNHNGYQYRCVVTDGNGNQATSNAVTLTVQ